MKAIFRAFSLLFMLAFALTATAQIGPGRLNTLDTDTLTNADTLSVGLVQSLDEQYRYTWQVSATNLSDTTNVTAYVQERLSADQPWFNRDTISFSDTGTTIVSGNTLGRFQRLILYSANTGQTEMKITYWYERRRF